MIRVVVGVRMIRLVVGVLMAVGSLFLCGYTLAHEPSSGWPLVGPRMLAPELFQVLTVTWQVGLIIAAVLIVFGIVRITQDDDSNGADDDGGGSDEDPRLSPPWRRSVPARRGRRPSAAAGSRGSSRQAAR